MLRTLLAALATVTATGVLAPVPATAGAPAGAADRVVGGVTDRVTDGATAATADPSRCVRPRRGSARPAWRVQRDRPRVFAAAARLHGRTVGELATMAEDRSLWLDSCGQRLYVEQAPEADLATDAAAGTTSAALPADVLALSSRPGAPRTIYLDFTGDVLTGTYWNHELGLASIPMDPFTLDAAVDTDFSEAERRAIYDAWLVVAEDYAPFDVDVTTRDPGEAALRRDSSADPTYGSRVLVTDGGVLNDWCGGCGGVAVVDVFDLVGSDHDFTQPALAFSGSVAGRGAWVGEVSSHEVGHHLGLEHDGRSTSAYYEGQGVWGPVMGAAYERALSQWSRGEYSGASSTQDDLALLAAGLPYRDDDHGDQGSPSALAAGSASTGVIEGRHDVDGFRFTGAGPTVITATPTSPFPNLDLGMTVLDAEGRTVAALDPPAAVGRDGRATGIGARWEADLPAAGGAFTVLLDGVGAGDPWSAGYSDYGSLGGYEVRLATGTPRAETSPDPALEPSPEPTTDPTSEPTTGPTPALTLALPTTRLAAARLHTRYRVRIVADGGSGHYRWRVRGDLPRGLRARVAADGSALRLRGRPLRLGRERFRVVVRDDAGGRTSRAYTVRVLRQT